MERQGTDLSAPTALHSTTDSAIRFSDGVSLYTISRDRVTDKIVL
jgi:hypothetical protein